jgi:hypothetical protein
VWLLATEGDVFHPERSVVERPAVSLIAKLYRLFQIVDTPESSEAILNTVLVGTPQQTNRTVVISGINSKARGSLLNRP